MGDEQGGRAGWRVPHANAIGQLLMITGLTGFAVSQPVLSVAGESPATFAFRSIEGVQLVLFALAVAFVPPLVIWGILRLIALVSARASDIAFVVAAAILAVAAGIQITKAFDIEASALIALGGLLVAAALVVAYLRVRSVDLWLRVTAILPVGAVLLFLFASPTSALLSPSSTGAATVDADGAPPVVFILLDELPTLSLLDDDRSIDADRFPNLASFATGATWYRDYTVPSNETLFSVPSILSGELPTSTAAVAAEHPDNVFTLLAPTHQLHVFESATKLCALDECAATAPASSGGLVAALGDMADVFAKRVTLGPTEAADLGEFEEEVVAEPSSSVAASPAPASGDDALDRMRAKVTATPARAVDFAKTFTQPSEAPGFHYLHLLLPHQPWTYYPDGGQYDGAGINIDNNEWPRALVNQRHLLQAQYADRVVGDLVASLRDSGRYDQSLVIITADHGISFKEVPNGRLLQDDRIAEVSYAPLFVKYPGQTAGEVSDANVMGTDLLPTIADVTGVDVTWDVVGASMRSDAVRDRGSAKTTYRFDDTARTALEFDESKRPRPTDRLIASLDEGQEPTSGLMARLGVEDLLGTDVDDLAARDGSGIAAIFDPATMGVESDGNPRGTDVFVLTADAARPGDIALVAFDGKVVAAAPVAENKFTVLWPGLGMGLDKDRLEVVIKGADGYTALRVT